MGAAGNRGTPFGDPDLLAELERLFGRTLSPRPEENLDMACPRLTPGAVSSGGSTLQAESLRHGSPGLGRGDVEE
jgi:hypothetical protein